MGFSSPYAVYAEIPGDCKHPTIEILYFIYFIPPTPYFYQYILYYVLGFFFSLYQPHGESKDFILISLDKVSEFQLIHVRIDWRMLTNLGYTDL